jgi:transcriptional regulator with XRE-family HTH domain
MKATIATIVGLNIKKMRESKSHSIIELADICNIDRTYLSNIEKGNRHVSITILEKISIGLQVDIKELFILCTLS